MLRTIFLILTALWITGVVTSNVMGGFIHLLIISAVVVMIYGMIKGERVV
ncbi:MAG: lmo0937 family membrane protein [Ignavibacteria bacterium]|nr:lmo0937 family membrane protein [Ignavibacteria bacterium]